MAIPFHFGKPHTPMASWMTGALRLKVGRCGLLLTVIVERSAFSGCWWHRSSICYFRGAGNGFLRFHIKTGGLSAKFQNGMCGNLHGESAVVILRKRLGMKARESRYITT